MVKMSKRLNLTQRANAISKLILKHFVIVYGKAGKFPASQYIKVYDRAEKATAPHWISLWWRWRRPLVFINGVYALAKKAFRGLTFLRSQSRLPGVDSRPQGKGGNNERSRKVWITDQAFRCVTNLYERLFVCFFFFSCEPHIYKRACTAAASRNK